MRVRKLFLKSTGFTISACWYWRGVDGTAFCDDHQTCGQKDQSLVVGFPDPGLLPQICLRG